MSRPFDRVAIVGVGLIGGSLGAAMRTLAEPPVVVGVARRAETRAWALAHGVLDEVYPPEEASRAFAGADLVVIATPARAAGEWFERLGEAGYSGVVTDVASTKAGVLADAGRYLREGAEFIGGHPMAGSEQAGVEAADAELFRGAIYVLTPTPATDARAYGRLHALVSSLGARVVAIPAAEHDEAVAAISHVPHVAASALTNVAAARASAGSDVLRLAAGGFKDMTRIAAGSAELWTGICLDNREAVVRGIEEYRDELERFSLLVAASDREGARAWLARAAEVREALPARWVPASERLTELSVPMTDRPGMVSSVTQAAARARCNIEDIGIDHTSEDTAVLRLVLTDEGDLDALVADLRADAFEPTLHPLAPEGGGA